MDEALKDTDFTFNPDVVDLDPQDQRDILHDVLAAENLTREQKNTIVEYVSNAALQKTIQETRQKQLDEEIQSQREFLQGAVNVETGTLVRGRLKGDESGQTIFITGGLRLKNNENQQAEIDLENSNEAIYYIENGEVVPTTADAIEFVNESGVEQEIQLISEYYQNAYQLQNTEVNAAVQQALMQKQAQQTQPQATEQPTTYAPGTTLEVNGQTFVVGEQDENGNYLINDENGQQIDRFAPDEMEAFGFSAAVIPATPSFMARATTSSTRFVGNWCCLLFTNTGTVFGLSSFSSFDAAIFNLLSLYSSSFLAPSSLNLKSLASIAALVSLSALSCACLAKYSA